MRDVGERLSRSFFERETVDVARELVGALLVTNLDGGQTAGRIVEVEAYRDASDLASHAARFRRGTVSAMHGPAGLAYVYRCYGIHAMFNVVAKPPGGTGAVLIRAVEPLCGIALMKTRRVVENGRRICSGPGRLCRAMGIELEHHGIDCLEDDRIGLFAGTRPAIVWSSERIGITRARDRPWRFFDAASAEVSVHRRGVPI